MLMLKSCLHRFKRWGGLLTYDTLPRMLLITSWLMNSITPPLQPIEHPFSTSRRDFSWVSRRRPRERMAVTCVAVSKASSFVAMSSGNQAELLSPFHYFGVPDEVDYEQIPWRSSYLMKRS